MPSSPASGRGSASSTLDLVLVPAKTDMITHNSLFGCARARAIELQTPACAVGAVGVPLGHPVSDTGVGGAAAFLPCDVSLSLDGVFAALPPQAAAAGTDPAVAGAEPAGRGVPPNPQRRR